MFSFSLLQCSLLYNEYIVYNIEQIRMRYVIHVLFDFKNWSMWYLCFSCSACLGLRRSEDPKAWRISFVVYCVSLLGIWKVSYCKTLSTNLKQPSASVYNVVTINLDMVTWKYDAHLSFLWLTISWWCNISFCFP